MGAATPADRPQRSFLRLYERITVIANEAEDVTSALQRAVGAVCAETGWPVGHVFVVSPDGAALTPTDIWHLDDAEEFATFRAVTAALVIEVGSGGLLARTASSGRPTWIEDVTVEPTFRRARMAEGIAVRGAFAFPVLVGQEAVAVMEFFSRVPAAPDGELLQVMAHVGAQLGRVFERARVRDLERRALEAERRYLSVAAHELRTPLTTTSGYLELLLYRWPSLGDDERRELVESASRELRRLASIVTNFLTHARLHAGALAPRLEDVALGDVVSGALEDVPAAASAAAVDVEDDLHVVADPFLLRQVLVNLLTNAHRYGAPPYELQARCRDGVVELRVRDHGPGVPADFVTHLFERFSRADEGGEGTGIGLAIVAGLVEVQGGSVGYEPAAPTGACFVLRLGAASGLRATGPRVGRRATGR